MPQGLTFSIGEPSREIWQTLTNGDVDATIAEGGTVMLASANVGQVSIDLPPSSANKDRMITVTKVDTTSNGVVISPDGSDTINGNPFITINIPDTSITMITDGTGDWRII